MSKKQMIRRRGLCGLLAVAMCIGVLPPTAGAAVTAENDWEIFDASDTYNLPSTQEQILQEMIQNPKFAEQWAAIANDILPAQFYADDDVGRKYFDYKDFTADSYSADNLKYTDKGLRDAVTKAVDNSGLRDGSGVIDKLPEGEFPVFYASTYETQGYSSQSGQYNGYHGTGYGYYVQAFYDFEIQGIADRFETPSIAADDTTASLEQKGYQFNLGGSSDSYKVTAENRNDFENTVEKSYTYEKSTTTSTTVSNTYSQNWTEETTVGVEFSVPVLAALSPTAKVEQSFSYSYGMEKTYESSKEESYAQSITDTISVPLPAHTGLDINVDVTDLQTTIPYTGAVRIKYKTMLIYVTGCYLDGKSQGHKWYSYKGDGRKSGVYTFGRNGLSAIEDLDARIQNRDVSGYDPDGLDMNTLYQGAFKTAADQLRSGQPVAPYFGSFHYTSKNTVITPQKVYPIYALDRLVPDTEQVSLYEQQSLRLDSIKVEAKNEHDVDWYGFNPRLSGEWTVVDEGLNDASEYAEVTTNRNGYPVLNALKPNDGAQLFLRYQPKDTIETTDDFNSELIELTILPVVLSSVTVEGSFEPFYFNDGSNTADVSSLTVTAKDEDGNDFDVTGKVKWYAEANDDITVDETTGSIEFTAPGTYQVYAVVNGMESNRVPLQVLPERQLDTLTVNGTIPNLIYNDDTANTFDLSTLNVEAKDQYGEDLTLDDGLFEWRLATDKGYAEISGSVITGLVVGTDTVTLYYPVGQDEQSETVYRTAQPLPVQVTAKPYLNELYYNDGAPAAVEGAEYDLSRIPLLARDQHGNPCGIPSDIEWTLADTNQTNATIENGKLLVAVGSVPDASYADVILEASSASAGKTAKNVVVKVEQQPTLKTIRADMKDGFVLRLDENAVLADQFTAAGYDQYGREMTGGSFEWVTSKPDVVSLENGTLKALKEDSTEIYARSGDIESNHLTLTVTAPRRLTAITADGVPSSVRKNAALDLSTVKVTTLDQFGTAFTAEELAAYPASVRWTLEKNDTHAVISGNTLSFGDQDGTMTLICAAVNADTNVIVEKKIIIRITDSTSGGGSSGGGGGGGGGGSVSIPDTKIPTGIYEHGTVTVSPESASKGDTVTITATPDKGYVLESLTVLDKDGKALELTDKGSGKYTFTMPAGKVTVKAVFMDDNTMLNFFTDVHAEDYYYDAVLWAAQEGITGGMSDTLFAPNAACTRAQIVTFLWRTAGSPEPKALSSFADVPADAYYAKAVAWAVENGITEGTSDTTFAPGTICTRAHGVTFLYRAAKATASVGASAFTDVADSAYYADAVKWATEQGITKGISITLFGPDETCTRAQIITFLYRMYGSK
ncbi:S-layer homology domain-containing protein [Agathobaculum butyriciproducens]|uniref:S-layer homology domain-containing protein n=1 Tax=Agathobaculum butyriciproducens TaxID=1628085 RepID=A0AAW4W2G1_9FIRM|nr:S-layer homology domain-containing protein [Agathobaculum butyriciproducens]